MSLVPKYYLLAGDTNQASFLFCALKKKKKKKLMTSSKLSLTYSVNANH